MRSIFTDFAIPVLFAVAAIASMLVVGETVEVDGVEERVSGWLLTVDGVLAGLALVVPFLMTRGDRLIRSLRVVRRRARDRFALRR